MPLVTVDVVVKKGNEFLLIKRRELPVKNQWCIIGGRLLFDESLLSGAKRQLREEANIKSVKSIRPVGVKELRFKKGLFGERIFSISNVFLAQVSEKDCRNIKIDKTSSDYKWFKKAPKSCPLYVKEYLRMGGAK